MHRTLRFAALTGALVLGLSGAAPQQAQADDWQIEARWSHRQPEPQVSYHDSMRRLLEERQRLLHRAGRALERGNFFRAFKLYRQVSRVEDRLRERRQQLARNTRHDRGHRHARNR